MIMTAIVAIMTAIKEQGLLNGIGAWGGILVMVVSYACGILNGWLGYERPKSMRPPPFPSQVPDGKDLR